jgi:hypothetical protein
MSTGTPDDPWVLTTPPGTSDYTMHRDVRVDVAVIVCTVGKTVLLYDALTDTLLLHGSVNDAAHCNPTLWTFQLSDGGSDGVSWGAPVNISGYLGRYGGVTPGPPARPYWRRPGTPLPPPAMTGRPCATSPPRPDRTWP